MDKNQLTSESGKELQALQFTLQRQDDQSKALQKVISTVIDTRNEMIDMKDAIEKDVQELRDSITLNRHEIAQVQSMVGKKAWKLTDELFGNRNISDDLFLAKSGHFRSVVYKKLKEKYDITRYFDIRRIDYKEALQVIADIHLEDLELYQLRLTARHKEIAIINNDDIKEFL